MGEDSAVARLSTWERVGSLVFFACPFVMLGAMLLLGNSLAGLLIGVATVTLMVWIAWSTRKSRVWKRNDPQP